MKHAARLKCGTQQWVLCGYINNRLISISTRYVDLSIFDFQEMVRYAVINSFFTLKRKKHSKKTKNKQTNKQTNKHHKNRRKKERNKQTNKQPKKFGRFKFDSATV